MRQLRTCGSVGGLGRQLPRSTRSHILNTPRLSYSFCWKGINDTAACINRFFQHFHQFSLGYALPGTEFRRPVASVGQVGYATKNRLPQVSNEMEHEVAYGVFTRTISVPNMRLLKLINGLFSPFKQVSHSV
jgi:hypothetical protein